MPLIGEFHGFYWDISDTNVRPVVISRGGYPGWQASVVAPSLFGGLHAWGADLVAKARYVWRLWRRVRTLPTDRATVLEQTLTLLESPTFPIAKQAVRETALTLGFNRPEAWKPYSHALKAEPGRAENVFRHIRACELTRTRAGSTMTNPTANLLTELAYHAYAAEP